MLFAVTFEDGEVLAIDDIIEFEEKQMDEIKNIASNHTRDILDRIRYAIDISYITDYQIEQVILKRDEIISFGKLEELYRAKNIFYSKHAIQRVYESYPGATEETFINLLSEFNNINDVTKMQWKGYPQLSYTLKSIEENKHRFQFAISFVKSLSSRKINIVTVTDLEIESRSMVQRLGEDDKMKALYEEMMKRFNSN